MPKEAEVFAESYAAYGDVVLKQDISSLITAILSGLGILVVDGYNSGLVFDIRNYPGRGVQEPEKDKVLRGARDGFCENVVTNTALIRRRIRDPRASTGRNGSIRSRNSSSASGRIRQLRIFWRADWQSLWIIPRLL